MNNANKVIPIDIFTESKLLLANEDKILMKVWLNMGDIKTELLFRSTRDGD